MLLYSTYTNVGHIWQEFRFYFIFIFRQKGRQANTKAREAVDHLEKISIKYIGDFTAGNQTANLFLEIWVSLQ